MNVKVKFFLKGLKFAYDLFMIAALAGAVEKLKEYDDATYSSKRGQIISYRTKNTKR